MSAWWAHLTFSISFLLFVARHRSLFCYCLSQLLLLLFKMPRRTASHHEPISIIQIAFLITRNGPTHFHTTDSLFFLLLSFISLVRSLVSSSALFVFIFVCDVCWSCLNRDKSLWSICFCSLVIITTDSNLLMIDPLIRECNGRVILVFDLFTHGILLKSARYNCFGRILLGSALIR